jgi:hypothetical protein
MKWRQHKSQNKKKILKFSHIMVVLLCYFVCFYLCDKTILELQRQKFEKKLVEESVNAESDPLITWYSYIAWARVS